MFRAAARSARIGISIATEGFFVKNKIRLISVLGSAVLLGACASSGKINAVSIGMTKEQVVSVMGQPDSISSQGGYEYMSYFLCYSNCAALMPQLRGPDWYYVQLISGKVESYGRKGDFDSTKTPTTRVERVDTIKQDVKIQDGRVAPDKYEELTKLKALLDAGTITKDEFEEQKKRILAR